MKPDRLNEFAKAIEAGLVLYAHPKTASAVNKQFKSAEMKYQVNGNEYITQGIIYAINPKKFMNSLSGMYNEHTSN